MTVLHERSSGGGTSSPPPITIDMIRHFPDEKNYSKYVDSVLADFRFVKGFFPLLNVSILPTVIPRELFIYGWLIPAELCDNAEKDANIKRFGIYILANYPATYPEDDVEVEDICRVIDWNLIPENHRHRKIIDGRPTGLCTHHPFGEINDVPFKHRTVKILASAWKLYYQYMEYIKTGIWNLHDLPHGKEALRILKRQGYKNHSGRKL